MRLGTRPLSEHIHIYVVAKIGEKFEAYDRTLFDKRCGSICFQSFKMKEAVHRAMILNGARREQTDFSEDAEWSKTNK